MPGPETYIAIAIFMAFAMAELLAGRFHRNNADSREDTWTDVLSGVLLPFLVAPSIYLAAPVLAETVAPGSKDAIAAWPWYAIAAILIIGDDMTQYWWHRLSHSVPWLYGLHRAHHEARYMGVRMVNRNNMIYYALMPGIWVSGTVLHLGSGNVHIVYLVIKSAVIIAAHSSVRWDERLYRIPALDKVMWILERTISTPATHAAHHGLHEDDGVTNYKGNFGNLFFFWDVLFGTAKITRRYPKAFGVEHLVPVSWVRNLFIPKIPRFVDEVAGAVSATQPGGPYPLCGVDEHLTV